MRPSIFSFMHIGSFAHQKLATKLYSVPLHFALCNVINNIFKTYQSIFYLHLSWLCYSLTCQKYTFLFIEKKTFFCFSSFWVDLSRWFSKQSRYIGKNPYLTLQYYTFWRECLSYVVIWEVKFVSLYKAMDPLRSGVHNSNQNFPHLVSDLKII